MLANRFQGELSDISLLREFLSAGVRKPFGWVHTVVGPTALTGVLVNDTRGFGSGAPFACIVEVHTAAWGRQYLDAR